MSTATKNHRANTNGKPRLARAQPAAANLTVNGVLRMIPLGQLVSTSDNQRRPITDASLKSLVQSIKVNGVLQPIIVRPHPTDKDCWEIRAGERRWRAAKLAGLATIPALVRALDDEAALAVTLVENLQREDLHPLEEAATVQRAIDEGFDLKALASKLGRTLPYLVRRASLTKLTSVWQQAVRKADSDAYRLSPAHLELIARLPPATQEKLAENDFLPVFGRGFPTVDELRGLINQNLQSLAAMPWKLDDESLEPKAGSCINCEKRSSKAQMLFPELGGQAKRSDTEYDRCLDPRCFQTKLVCHLNRRESRLREKHPSLQLVQLGVDDIPTEVGHALNGRVQTVYYPHVVKASDDGAQPVMPINGPKLGKLIYLELGSSANSHQNGHHGRPRGEQGKVIPLTLEEKQARLQKRRDALVVKEVRTILEGLSREWALTIASPPLKKGRTNVKTLSAFECLALLISFGSLQRADSTVVSNCWERYEKMSQESVNGQAATALIAVIEVWIKRLNTVSSDHVSAQAADAKRICDLLDLDHGKIAADATIAIPVPKSWPKPIDTTEAGNNLAVASA